MYQITSFIEFFRHMVRTLSFEQLNSKHVTEKVTQFGTILEILPRLQYTVTSKKIQNSLFFFNIIYLFCLRFSDYRKTLKIAPLLTARI